jgi:hypothetical protein
MFLVKTQHPVVLKSGSPFSTTAIFDRELAGDGKGAAERYRRTHRRCRLSYDGRLHECSPVRCPGETTPVNILWTKRGPKRGATKESSTTAGRAA